MKPEKSLVSLRPVDVRDLPIFFTHQLDSEAARLSGFPSRDREAFMTHWTTRILGNPDAATRAILFEDQLAGNVGAWTDAGEPPAHLSLLADARSWRGDPRSSRSAGESHERLLCYWIGREFWGRGIATAAVLQFLQSETTRPITAHVAKHNLGSIRVLEKTGFTCAGEDAYTPPGGTRFEEFIYVLKA